MLRGEKVSKTVQLCIAARTGDVKMLQRASKSALNQPDDEGMTPAMWSAARGQLTALHAVVERGADAERVDMRGNTALHHAVLNNQQLCAVFLVQFGVNLWTLNDDLMSAYDVAAVKDRVSLARFLDSVASQALVDDWQLVMKMCRRAARNAKRRLQTRTHESCSARQTPNINHQLRAASSQVTDGWRMKTLPDGTSSSRVCESLPTRSSSMFVQTPRLTNGRLFPPSVTDLDTTQTQRQRRRRPTQHVQRHMSECCAGHASQVASAARRLLLVAFDEGETTRHQQRLSAETTTTNVDTDNRAPDGGVSPRCHIDSQFYYRAHVSDNRRSSEMTADGGVTHANTAAHTTSATRQQAAASASAAGVGVVSDTATDRTSTCSGVYCVPADCIQCDRSRLMSYPTGRHCSSVSQSQSSCVSSKSMMTSVDVNDYNDDELRRWLVKNGLGEYWRALATEKVDMEALAFLREEDLQQLGIPLGPRRRLQHAVSQAQMSSSASLTTTAESPVPYTTHI